MKQTRLIMGMPVTVEIGDKVSIDVFETIFDYFTYVDNKYSTYKPESEVSRINAGLPRNQWSVEMAEVMDLCDQTKRQTSGFFDVRHGGKVDPSGLVKGWAIRNAAKILAKKNIENFYIDAGGDIQVSGKNPNDAAWRVGIRNPFNRDEIIKVIDLPKGAVATSGTTVRGQHIYDPHQKKSKLIDVVSLTVIGPDIFNADRFATAAFAMGDKGIAFIEAMPRLEGYMINANGMATMTSGFNHYTAYA